MTQDFKVKRRPAVDIACDGFGLRSATADDSESLLSILAEPSVKSWWGDFDTDRVVRELIDNSETLVIIDDDQPAGFIQVTEEADPDYRHASLDIAIGSSHQGEGLGTRSLTAAIRYLIEERGHHRITIDPRVDNERAIACYRKVGFKEVGVMRQYERSGPNQWADGLLMELLADEFRSRQGPA